MEENQLTDELTKSSKSDFDKLFDDDLGTHGSQMDPNQIENSENQGGSDKSDEMTEGNLNGNERKEFSPTSSKKNRKRIVFSDSDDSDIDKNDLIDDKDDSKGPQVECVESGSFFNERSNEGADSEPKASKSRLKIIDSDENDSENESKSSKSSKSQSQTIFNENSNEGAQTSDSESKSIKKGLKIIDSDDNDSENESKSSQCSKSTENERTPQIKSKLSTLCDSDSSDEEINQSSPVSKSNSDCGSPKTSLKRSTLSKLYDSDSEEDSMLNFKKSRGKKPDKPKQMTGKEALEQRKEIISESQRMTRESYVTLPYHRSKSHSLQEFLANRKKVSDVIKNKIPLTNLKLTSKQIEIAAKTLEEREKNLDEFYKSESESQSDEENNTNSPEPPQTHQDSSSDTKNLDTEKTSDYLNEIQTILNENPEKTSTDCDQNGGQISMEIDSPSKTPLKDPTADQLSLNEPKSDETQENSTDFHENAPKLPENHSQNPQNDSTIDATIEKQNGDTNVNSSKNEENDKNIDKTVVNIDVFDVKDPNLDVGSVKSGFENCEIEEKTKQDGGHGDDLKNDDMSMEIDKSGDLKDVNSEKSVETVEQSANDDPKTLSEPSSSTCTQSVKKLTLLEKLKKLNPNFDLKSDFKPRISKDSEVIILDDDREKSKAIDDLKKRFITHNKMKYVHTMDEKDIKNIDTNVLKHECAKVLIEHDNIDRVCEQVPGVKLKKLREELVTQMAKKRLQDWEKQRKETDELTKTDAEKDVCDALDQFDDEEEEEMTESSSSESEPEENDIILTDKVKTKSHFVDSEAEVSSDEESDESEADDSETEDGTDLKIEGKGLKRIILNDDDSNDFSDQGEEKETNLELKKSLKDIISGLSDDSNQTKPQNDNSQNSNLDLHDTISLNSDDEFPLGQNENLNKTPLQTQTKSQFNFTPISFLTGSKDGLDLNPPITLTTSPVKDVSEVKTKLFESSDIGLTQAFNELENLCSGTFTESKFFDSQPPSSQDCNSQDLKLVFDEEFMEKDEDKPVESEKKEDESEAKETENVIEKEKAVEKKGGKLVLLSSDDENNSGDLFEEKAKKKRKKKKKKLGFSDDEASSESELELEEEREINYDSEENEINFDENEEVVTKKVAQGFFEAEAELSESEWGSDDEDERGLDVLEREDGDQETFNEKQLQKELGRIHMRQVLDQDNREVRLLQEMLLEDGELHGASREKKFKWKNADSMTWNDENKPQEDDNEDLDEMESELQWRKERHEREVFIQEERKKILQSQNEIELIASDSQILQIGKTIIKSQESIKTPKESNPSKETNDLSYSVLNHKSFRGSFLARGELSLNRLSELTKIKSKDVVITGPPKNNRNFLFTSVEKDENELNENKKRKITNTNTPKVLKKMRVAESPSGSQRPKKVVKKLL